MPLALGISLLRHAAFTLPCNVQFIYVLLPHPYISTYMSLIHMQTALTIRPFHTHRPPSDVHKSAENSSPSAKSDRGVPSIPPPLSYHLTPSPHVPIPSPHPVPKCQTVFPACLLAFPRLLNLKHDVGLSQFRTTARRHVASSLARPQYANDVCS